jgi:hypothetical protein
VDDEEVIIQGGYRGPLNRLYLASLFDPITVAAAAGFVAAIVHALVVREHLAHWWGYGWFFTLLAAVQAVTAISLLRRPSKRFLVALAACDLGLIALYVISRTAGVPVGPHAGTVEPVAPIDLIAKAAEALQVGAIVLALSAFTRPEPRLRKRWTSVVVLAPVLIAALAGPAGAARHQPPPGRDVVLAGTHESPQPEEAPAEEAPPEPAVEESVPEEPWRPCVPRSVTAQFDGVRSTAVLYVDGNDLWFAGPPTEEPRRLTSNGNECWAGYSSFRDRDTVSFAADRSIYDVDLRTGRLTRLLSISGDIAAMAWNPDGSKLAILDWGGKLRLYAPASDRTDVIRSFEDAGGRCGSMDDDTSVAWSADGRSILIVHTLLDFTHKTMFVVDLAGANIIAPRYATHALWVHGDTIVYREYEGQRRWFSLDVTNDSATSIAMKAGTHQASVSPDGRYIVYSEEEEIPNLYLYDVARDTERVLTRGWGGGIWLSDDEIAATKTKPCDESCMGMSMWLEAGTTAAFDRSGVKLRSMPMTSTIQADVLIIQESPAPSPAPTPTTPAPIEPSPTPEPSPSTPTSSPSPTPTSTGSPEPTPTPTTEPSP